LRWPRSNAGIDQLDASVSCTRAASVESVLEESSTHQRRIALILPTALRAAMYTCRKPQASRRMGGFIGTGNTMTDRFDAIVVGAGLAGLTAAAELTRAGKRTLLLDQEGEQNLGGRRSGRSAVFFSWIRPNSAAWA